MNNGRIILSQQRFALTVDRLCHQLIERYGDFDQVCLVGVQERGVLLADRMMERLSVLNRKNLPEYGKLDITFFRDDFRHRDKPLKAASTEMNFLVEDKSVVIVDDVLYTGRTIQAAMSALQAFGRPKHVELLCLVDRRFNRHLPISPDYSGITVDALDEAYVKVEWEELNGEDKILFFSAQNEDS